MLIASAAAVASSRREAFDMAMPARGRGAGREGGREGGRVVDMEDRMRDGPLGGTRPIHPLRRPKAPEGLPIPPLPPSTLRTCQVRHHGLEVEQTLQPALGDLGLVRRVGCVPSWVLQHVSENHARGGWRKGGREGGRERGQRKAQGLDWKLVFQEPP